MIPFNKLDLSDVIFTHIDDDTGKNYHYAISRIMPQLQSGLDKGWAEKLLIPVEREVAEYCIKNRGVERHRLLKLLLAPQPFHPIIFGEMPDKTHLLLDGTHRYVAACALGLKEIRAIAINNRHRKRFLIKDFPFPDDKKKELVNSFSGNILMKKHDKVYRKVEHKAFTLTRNNGDGDGYGVLSNSFLFCDPPRSILLFNTEEIAKREVMKFQPIQRFGINIIPVTVTWMEEVE